MPAFVTFGRVLFAVLFIVSGATKLFDLATTADLIASKVVIPAALTSYTAQLESMTGMETKQMLAIAAGAVELICGLMIALNFGARFFSLLLILFVVAGDILFSRLLESDRRGRPEQLDPCHEEPIDHRRAVHHRRDRPGIAGGRCRL